MKKQLIDAEKAKQAYERIKAYFEKRRKRLAEIERINKNGTTN